MLTHVVTYAVTAAIFLAIDFVWLSMIARTFYADRLRPLLLDQPNLVAATGFYLVYAIGLVIFAVAPALREQSLATAVIFGGLFGFFAYATYDMTNYATLRDWPISVVVVDIAWGTFINGVSASLGYLAMRALPMS